MLKLDPKNTELLSQKQTVLRQNIEATKNKLQELKNAQDLYIKSGGDLNSAEYRNLQREIVKTENELKQLNLQNSSLISSGTQLKTIGSRFQEVGNIVQSVGKKVSVLSGAVAGLFAVGIKFNADIETTTKAFETFLGSAEEAKRAINEIKKSAKTSPFNTKDLIKANQYLITTGESADEARKTISALADAIALTGGGNDELSRMALNLQQIKNQTKASGTDLKQFAMAGIDIYGILAETTGKNVAELKKMDITYEDLSKALQKASGEGGKYFNGQTTMASTLNGKISALKKTFEELWGELSESLMPVIDKLITSLQELTEWFKGLTPEQKEMVTQIGLIVVALGPVLLIIGKLITSIGSIISLAGTLSTTIGTASASVGGLGASLSAVIAPIAGVIAVIGALVGIFIGLWNSSESFRQKMQEIGQQFVDTYNEYIKPSVDNITSALSTLWNDLLKPLLDFLWSVFGPIFEVIFTQIGEQVSAVFRVIGIVINTITGVFKGLIDFIAGVFTGNWEKAWNGIVGIFGSIFGGIIDLVKMPLNWIIKKLNQFFDDLGRVKIPDWIPRNRRKINTNKTYSSISNRWNCKFCNFSNGWRRKFSRSYYSTRQKFVKIYG